MKKKWKFDQGERKRENNATLKIFLIDEVRARTFCLQAGCCFEILERGEQPPTPAQAGGGLSYIGIVTPPPAKTDCFASRGQTFLATEEEKRTERRSDAASSI